MLKNKFLNLLGRRDVKVKHMKIKVVAKTKNNFYVQSFNSDLTAVMVSDYLRTYGCTYLRTWWFIESAALFKSSSDDAPYFISVHGVHLCYPIFRGAQ